MDIGNLSSTDVIFQGFLNDTKLALNRVWENYNNPNPNPNTKPCNLVKFLKNSNFPNIHMISFLIQISSFSKFAISQIKIFQIFPKNFFFQNTPNINFEGDLLFAKFCAYTSMSV